MGAGDTEQAGEDQQRFYPPCRFEKPLGLAVRQKQREEYNGGSGGNSGK